MEILVHGAAQLGLSLSTQHLERFQTLYDELCAWNERLNLTAITGYQEVQTRHLLDSLACLLAFPAGEPSRVIPNTVPVQRPGNALRCLDLGTGAGFPGLPLKILLPDLRLTLLESVGKKVTWLQHIVRQLNLSDVEIILGRAEEVAHVAAQRETYDVVVARAVAPLNVLVEYCLPFCRPGGRMIAPRGEDAVREGSDAGAPIALLGGRLVAVREVPPSIGLPDHYLVVIDKVEKTSERYPRRTGIPSKRPLAAGA
jgi:16S rRNA (guanine527-N7)-methyltransferase